MNAKELNTLRGKCLVVDPTKDEVVALFEHIYKLEDLLDEANDYDTFGTEGWRRYAGCE